MNKILNITKIAVSTVILGVAASIFHFLYKLSGNNIIVGLFCPVNESVWEHLKLMFFPFIIYWIAFYFLYRKEFDFSLNTYIATASTASLLSPFLVILFFYSYTGALGIESVIADILLVFICYFLSLLLASHLLNFLKAGKACAVVKLLCVFAVGILFFVFTFIPPDLPIFISK